MNKKAKLALALLPLLSLTACMPPLTAEQCKTMDWKQMGLNDGMNAHRRDLSREISQCSQFGVNVRADQYQAGYTQGIRQYCTYEHGLSMASQGQSNPGVCPADLGFNKGFQKGTTQFCEDPDRGFSLGSQGAGYPGACDPLTYPAFSNQYNRGHAIYARTSALQNQSENINDRIDHLVHKYHLRQRTDGSYTLGTRDNPDARNALAQVNEMAWKRDHLEDKAFQAQTLDAY